MNPKNKAMAMQMQSEQVLQLVLVVILIAATKIESILMSKPNCQSTCGSVTIPYPFGMTKECSLNTSFLITCNQTSRNTHTPFWENQSVRVLNISLDGELRVSLPASRKCYDNRTGEVVNRTYSELWDLGPFQLSPNRNKLTVVGVDTAGFVVPYTLINTTTSSHGQGRHYTASTCLSLYSDDLVENGSCSGIGCCETTIRQGLSLFYYYTHIKIFNNSYYNNLLGSYPCSYTFLAEERAYNFNSTHLVKFNDSTPFPVVLDWAVGNHTCKEAMKDASTYACKSHNSTCLDANGGTGYLCNCSLGYYGNPYLSGGCHDVDECGTSDHDCVYECYNLNGSYGCFCPEGFEGDGKNNGTSCSPKPSPKPSPKHSNKIVLIISLCVSIGILALLGVSFYVCWAILKKRKLIKLKNQFFRQNGGLLLQQQIGSAELAKVFTMEELKEATDNFNECKILGQGGYGTVYKGVLQNTRTVAIKKSKVSDPNQIEQFINEVIVLSQVNHKNVVKLLGCCLETEVPLLVYEFIPNGTLYEHLHVQNHSLKLTWETRLGIATETAGALAYLHSAASVPIIHRDVKTTNILLDHNMTAKVSDFGSSRIFPLDQTQLTTLVQGTLGYLDPEYFHTSQLTEKSDVYSFGVVLAELLTGKKALSFDRPEVNRNLAVYFVSSMKEGRLLHIVDNHIVHDSNVNVEQLMEVANIARQCLRVKGEERPTMKEVAMELEGIRAVEKHRRESVNNSLEESESLLQAESFVFNVEDGPGGSGNISSFGSINKISMTLDDER